MEKTTRQIKVNQLEMLTMMNYFIQKMKLFNLKMRKMMRMNVMVQKLSN